MNWTTLLKFRKQVEDLAREALVLAEWEKSREKAKLDDIHQEIETVSQDLGHHLRSGTDSMFAEERYRWLDSLNGNYEIQTRHIQTLEQQLEILRDKLKKAYHARRVVELVIAKKEEELLKTLARREQRLHDEISAHAYAMRSHEEISQ